MAKNLAKDSNKAKPWAALRSNSILIPLITIGGLLICFSAYVFWYVSGQEGYYNDRAFRVLSALNQKFSGNILGIQEVLGASTAYPTSEKGDATSPDQSGSVKGYVADHLEPYGVTPEKVDASWEGKCTEAHRDEELHLIEGGSTDSFSLKAEYSFQGDADGRCHGNLKISVPLRADPVIRPLFDDLNESFFDDLFIADEDGKVLYQHSTGGDRVANLNELVNHKADGTPLIPTTGDSGSGPGPGSPLANNPPGKTPAPSKAKRPAIGTGGTRSAMPKAGTPGGTPGDKSASQGTSVSGRTTAFRVVTGASNVLDVKIAGSAFKLYVQPSTVAIQKDSLPKTLVLCGLRSTSHANEEAHSLPSIYVIRGTLALLLVLSLGWPILKIFYVSPKQRLPLTQSLLILLTILLAGWLLASAALNWTYANAEETESRENLKKLAADINSKASAELSSALKELDHLSQPDLPKKLAELLPKEAQEKWQVPYYFRKEAKSYTNPQERYPWFRYAFWVDKDGKQQLKIAAGTETPQVNIGKADYFRPIACEIPHNPTACADGLPPFQNRPPDAIGKDQGQTEFLIQPNNSPNTGEFVVIIGSQSGPTGPKVKDSQLPVEYIVNKFESLVNPILPPGYGFAVLNADGKVQFHSIAHRNLIEDFFQEIQPDTALRTRVATGSSGFVSARYLGRQQLLYATPLDAFQKPPLTLVVFRSYEHFIASTVRVNAWSGILALGYIAVLCVAAALYLLWHKKYPLADVWPVEFRQCAYVNVTVTNALLISAFLLRYCSLDSFNALFAAFGLGIVGVIYPLGEMASEGKGRRIATRSMVLVYLIALAKWGWDPSPLLVCIYAAYFVKVRDRFSYLPEFLKPGKKRLKYTYTMVAISLLVATIIVPCLGFFKFGYDVVEVPEGQEEQVQLFRALDRRNENIRAYFRRIDAPDLEKVRRDETLDRHDQAVSPFPPKVAPRGSEMDPAGAGLPTWLSACCSGLFPPENQGPGEFMWGKKVLPTKNMGGKSPPSGAMALIMQKAKQADSEAIVSEYPSWPGLDAQGICSLIAAGLLLTWWFYSLTCRIFFINWIDARCLDEIGVGELKSITAAATIYKHVLVVGHPKSGKSSFAKGGKIGFAIDIAELASTGNWEVILPQEERIIILDHFDFGMDTAEINLKKLGLLERLIYVEHRNVIILSTVDLMFYLASGCPEIVWTDPDDMASAIQVLDRWASLLSLFLKARLCDDSIAQFNKQLGMAQEQQDSPAGLILIDLVRTECDHTAMLRRVGSNLLDSNLAKLKADKEKQKEKEEVKEEDLREPLVKDVLDRADAYYRALWATCTKDERLVLFQLSKDGWLNPKNERAIQELQRRNLVTRNQGFRMMNESFRRFILEYQYPEEIAAWEEEVRRSGWHAARNAVALAGLLVGAWLAYSQQESFHLAIGYAGAISGAVVTVSTLVSALRGRGAKTAPPGAQAA
jgi:hypothetical protein